MIRGKLKECPFGLPITEACINIGAVSDNGNKVIDSLVQIESAKSKKDKAQIIEDNMDILLLIDNGYRCPYSNKIYEDKGSVDCRLEDNQTKSLSGDVGITGSSIYPYIMTNKVDEEGYDQHNPSNPSNPSLFPTKNPEYNNDDGAYYGICSLIG